MCEESETLTVRETMVDIIADQLNVNKEKIEEEKTLLDLGADSLDVIEIEMEIEKHFGFSDGAFFEDELSVGLKVKDIIEKAERVYKDNH